MQGALLLERMLTSEFLRFPGGFFRFWIAAYQLFCANILAVGRTAILWLEQAAGGQQDNAGSQQGNIPKALHAR